MYIKCMNDTKTKCFIVMQNVSKSEISKNFGPLIEHGPHCINFIIITFISENNRYQRFLYKIWNKIISFDIKKRKSKTWHKKNEKKGEFESLGISI